jgi:hypothetical protein
MDAVFFQSALALHEVGGMASEASRAGASAAHGALSLWYHVSAGVELLTPWNHI